MYSALPWVAYNLIKCFEYLIDFFFLFAISLQRKFTFLKKK